MSLTYNLILSVNNDNENDIRKFGITAKNLQKNHIVTNLQVSNLIPSKDVEFKAISIVDGVHTVHQINQTGHHSIPSNSNIIWSCPVEVVDGVNVEFLSNFSPAQFETVVLTAAGRDMTAFSIVDDKTKREPVFRINSCPKQIRIIKKRAKYSELSLMQVLIRVLLPDPTVDETSMSTSSRPKRKASTVEAEREHTFNTLVAPTMCTGRLDSAVTEVLPQLRQLPEWNMWVERNTDYLNVLHKVIRPMPLHEYHLESPRRCITDPLLATTILFVAEEKGVNFETESKLYKDADLPEYTIGWGPVDYLSSKVVIFELRQEDSEEAETEEMEEDIEQQEAVAFTEVRTKKPKGMESSSSSSFEGEARVIAGNIEMKRREKMNSNGLAQTIAQGIDLGNKMMDDMGSAASFPFSTFSILSSGQRYYVFTLTWKNATTNPLLLFHGMKSVRVLPYLGELDVDNSGLHISGEVEKEQVEEVMAALYVCLSDYLDVSNPNPQSEKV